MRRFEITRRFTVERTFEVDAPSDTYALAHPEEWERTGEITLDVLDTDISELDEIDIDIRRHFAGQAHDGEGEGE